MIADKGLNDSRFRLFSGRPEGEEIHMGVKEQDGLNLDYDFCLLRAGFPGQDAL
jgi:hypothetical protein